MSNIEQAVSLSLKYLLLQKKGYISIAMFIQMVTSLCDTYSVKYSEVASIINEQTPTIDFENSSIDINVVKKEEENE